MDKLQFLVLINRKRHAKKFKDGLWYRVCVCVEMYEINSSLHMVYFA